MQNLKIRVSSEAESREAQELFFELGYEWHGSGKSVSYLESVASDEFGYLVAWKPGCFSKYIIQMGCGKEDAKEITLPELRAMVNPMKEYLDANRNYEFVLSTEKYDGFIEIPEGAEAFGYTGIVDTFYKDDFRSFLNENTDGQWDGRSETWVGMKEPVILWQRDQDEPFLTPECTLNDQYAEIEQVRQVEIHGSVKAKPDFNFGAAQASGGVDATLAERQSTYGNFEDVAFVTENIIHILAKVRVNGLDDLPNTHRMALYMIASKMARIVNGDFNHLDSWHDIGGYAKLIEKLIKGE